MLLVRRAPRLEVYWVERAALLSYLGGFHAFPGGRVGTEDAEVPVVGVEDPAEARFRVAAARELFEETGVLLARAAAGGEPRRPRPDERAPARAALIEGSLPFRRFLGECGLAIDGALLKPAGRWVSPAVTPRGFDTRFYLAECPAGESPSVIPGELASGEWVEPARGRTAWDRGEVLLAVPVQRGLTALVELAGAVADQGAGEDDAAFAAALERCAEALRAMPEGGGGPMGRVEMTPGVVMVPLATRTLPPATHTNCYVVGEGECLVVDPGSAEPAALAALAGVLARLAEEGRRPVAITVTHAHRDHSAGVETLRRKLGLPVWTHPGSAQDLRADRVLADGEVLELAGGRGGPWRLEALFTPGHARHHVAFLERERGVLVAGDLVSGLSTVVIDPPEGDLSEYLASLRRLAELPARSLFPGHGPPGGGARPRLAQLIEHRRWREERVLEALRAGPGSIDELLPGVYEDAARSQWRWARRSLLAHLEDLERRGRARRDAGAAPDGGPATEDERGIWRLV